MAPKSQCPGKEYLEYHYSGKKESIYAIAEEVGVYPQTVHKWLVKFDIPRRSINDYGHPIISNKMWLENQYVILNKQPHIIAKENNTKVQTVRYWLYKHNIPRKEAGGIAKYSELTDEDWLRSQYEVLGKTGHDIARELGCEPSVIYKWLRKVNIPIREAKRVAKHPMVDKSWIYDQYIIQAKSSHEIAKELGTNDDTLVRFWLEKHGIPRRNRVNIGPKNGRWCGGKSFEPYCINFNNKIKEEVRERFSHKCYICGKTEVENGKRLEVHHVDYNKSQGCAGLKWSLITLCRSCHTKTNFHRWHWFAVLRDYWMYEYIDFCKDGWIQ